MNQIIQKNEYDFIINAIGILNQMAEDNKANAVFLNSYLPHYLAEITKNTKTRIIQISTDCVFSGKEGNYNELSFPDGKTFYDRTKALGELIDNKNITLRNSIIGPDINSNGIGLFNWFMKQKDEINGYSNVLWTGITTIQLAKVIDDITKNNVYGLFNMVPEHNISKYELIKLFNLYFKNGSLKINRYDKVILDKTLIRTNFLYKKIMPDYEIMIKEMKEWIINHKSLYKHYQII